jgi:hypothetical protein
MIHRSALIVIVFSSKRDRQMLKNAWVKDVSA